MNNNNQQLIELRNKHKLSYARIHEVTGFSWYSVKAWLLHSNSKAYRSMPDRALNKLKLSIKG